VLVLWWATRRYSRGFVVVGLVEIAVYALGVTLGLAVVAAALVVAAKGVTFR
jgi:hypothetical protein